MRSLLKRLISQSPFRSERRAHPCAVLFTDMVGSTAAFAKDDPRALALLERHNAILYPIVEDAGGTIIKSTGDGFLIVFEHPSDSARAAFAMQKALAEANDSEPEEGRINIRIGIHYGLVFAKRRDVFGDTVNLAARVNAVAKTDRVFVSRVLRDFLRANPAFQFQSHGLFELKGIPEKLELFELMDAPPVSSAKFPLRLVRRGWRKTRSHPIRGLLLFLALALAGGLYLLFSPAQRPSLAVLDFENHTGDQQLDRLEGRLSVMLQTGLSQYEGLRVVSRARIFEVLHSLVREDSKKDDPSLPLKVARGADAGLILVGELTPASSSFYLNFSLLDAAGNTRGGGRLLVDDPRTVQAQVDELIFRVAGRLGIASGSVALRPVSQLTSRSPLALDLFLEGENKLFRMQLDQAIDKFQQAIVEDPEFAQAYMRLFWAKSWKGDISGKKIAMERAREHFTRLAPREQKMLEVYETYARVDLAAAKSKLREMVKDYPDDREARYRLGFELEDEKKFEEAVAQYEKVLELYPRFSLALHRLANVLARKGDIQGAITTAAKIFTLEPREPKSYLTAGDIYVQAHRYPEAVSRYREGYQVQPNFDDYLLLTRIANAERLMLNFDQSRTNLELYTAKANPLGVAYGRFLLGDLAFFAGDFNKAAQQYQDSVAAFQQLQQPNPAVHVTVRLAELLAFQGRYDEALAWVDQAQTMASSEPLRLVARRNRIVILAKKGDWRKAEAEVGELERKVASLSPEPWRQGWVVYCRAQIELAKGNLSEAKRWMSQAASDIGRPADLGILLARQGQYHDALERLSTAIREYESLALDPSYAVWHPTPFYYVLAYYQRAKAYRALGQPDKARQDFQNFLAYWSGASHQPEVIEATKYLYP